MENDLSRILDDLPALVWTALPDGDVDFVNQRWCDYTGLTLDAARALGWQTTIHPVHRPELAERWRSSQASGQPVEAEVPLRRFDGEYRWFLVRSCPLAGASTQLLKWSVMATDNHDKRSDEAVCARWWLLSSGREAHFRAICDGIPSLISLVTPAGEVEIVNRHVLEYFDVTPESLKGQTTTDTLHMDDLPKVMAAWQGSVEAGVPYQVEARRRRADGVYCWFHMHGFPLRDVQGHIVYWFLLERNVDERKRAVALLAGEKHVLEMVATGVALTKVLDALCISSDATAEECSSSSVLLLDRTRTSVGYVAGPGLPSSYTRSLEGRAVESGEGPCVLAASLKTQVIVSDIQSDPRWQSGDWQALALAHGLRSCCCSPIFSLTGELLGVFTIYRREVGSPTPFHQALIEQFTHIASIAIERTRSEEALRRSEAFLAEAQHLSSTGSFSWRVATGEVTWSEEAYRIFELAPALPVTLELLSTRIHPEDWLAFKQQVERSRRDGRDVEFEFRLQLPNHSVKFLRVISHRSRYESGDLEYAGAIQDLTQRRLAEDAVGKLRSELARVARITSLGALTASIAHEVNQPLSGIFTNAGTCLRMLNSDPANIDGARETARRTIRDARRASDVIMRLRALFGKKSGTMELLDLNEATREVIALSLSELQRSGVALLTQLTESLPRVRGDRVQLQQVIMNLVLNALEAMRGVDDRPRQLVIRTEPDEKDHVRLTVEDSGVGFEPQGVDRLFDAFYTTKSAGMGIGLFVSRSIIENHQGRLWAVPNEGAGATFSFSIPCARDGVTGSDKPDAIPRPAVTDAMHALRRS